MTLRRTEHFVRKDRGMNTADTSDISGCTIGRRMVVTGFAVSAVPAVFSAAASEVNAAAVTTPGTPEDERLIWGAIALAAEGDLPFGAVIARHGAPLANGLNRTKQDPTAHSVMVAIRHFISDYGAEPLKGTTLYASSEPCPMCMGAIVWCGIARVVYGTSIADLGARSDQIMMSCTEVAAKAPFAKIEITGDVLADEAIKLFR
jgi:tRNA(adenine34) deaminase